MTNSKLSFSKISPTAYAVRLNGVLAGTVEKITDGYWSSRYNDGSPGYAADRRIDAAWAMVNS